MYAVYPWFVLRTNEDRSLTIITVVAFNAGLVYKVTELFFARGLRVDQLHTDTKIAPFGGTVLFLMDGIICADRVSAFHWQVSFVSTHVRLHSRSIPTHEQPIDFKELEEASESLSSFLGIDLELRALPEQQNE